MEQLTDIVKMRPQEIFDAVIAAVEMKEPLFIWGPPGVGKSDVVRQVAEHFQKQYGGDNLFNPYDHETFGLIDLRAILLDPVDLRGLPHINGDKRAHWAIPDFLPRVGRGILFVDEINAAPPLVQAALYQLILDRRLGEYFLPDGWVVMAAGNREGDRAVTHRMPSALANRFMHIEFMTSVDDWCKWAYQHDIATEIISAVRFCGMDLLYNFNPQKNLKAFPTPRSIAKSSKIFQNVGNESLRNKLIEGTIGKEASITLYAHVSTHMDLPSMADIMSDPENAPLPSEPSAIYATIVAMARQAKKATFANLYQYSKRLSEEFTVLFVKDAVSVSPEVIRTKEYVSDFAVKFADLVL